MPITNDFDEFERKYKENNKGLFDIQNPLVCRNKYLENKIKVYEKNFKELEEKLDVYESDDSEVTSTFIENFLDREKINEENYKDYSKYFNKLKLFKITKKFKESKDCEAQIRKTNKEIMSDYDEMRYDIDYLEKENTILKYTTLSAVICQWNLMVFNREISDGDKIKPFGYNSEYDVHEFIGSIHKYIDDCFGELVHNINMAWAIDYGYGDDAPDLEDWRVIIKQFKVLEFLNIHELLERFPYCIGRFTSDDFKKAIENQDNPELLEDSNPDIRYEKIRCENWDMYIVCENHGGYG